MILLKQKIYFVKIHKEAIYVQILNKILVFELLSLKFLFAISDVNSLSNDKLLISEDMNPVVIAYQPSSRLYQLKIAKRKFYF